VSIYEMHVACLPCGCLNQKSYEAQMSFLAAPEVQLRSASRPRPGDAAAPQRAAGQTPAVALAPLQRQIQIVSVNIDQR
jgi:hypothetical protein